MQLSQIVLVILLLVVLALFFFIGSTITLWVQALVSGASVGLLNIIFMRFRKVPPKLIVESKIMAVKAGLEISTNQLESHYLAGGNVLRVVQALIAADKANIELNFNRAAAIDLAGRNVLEAVQMSVNPKVIETPLVAGVAKDGIQLKAISRVTVRANIDRSGWEFGGELEVPLTLADDWRCWQHVWVESGDNGFFVWIHDEKRTSVRVPFEGATWQDGERGGSFDLRIGPEDPDAVPVTLYFLCEACELPPTFPSPEQ
jgi:hypothetical protein